MSKRFFLVNAHVLSNCQSFIGGLELRDKKPYEVHIKEATRRVIQNDLMWVLLGKLSKKMTWPVTQIDGSVKNERLKDWEWKNLLSASLIGETRLAQCPNGNGMIMIGHSTRNETVSWMSDMIEFIYAFASSNGIELD